MYLHEKHKLPILLRDFTSLKQNLCTSLNIKPHCACVYNSSPPINMCINVHKVQLLIFTGN